MISQRFTLVAAILWACLQCGVVDSASLGAELSLLRQTPTAMGANDVVELRLSADAWNRHVDHRIHVAIDDGMPTSQPALPAERSDERVLVKLQPADWKAEAGQRLSIWIDARPRGRSPERVSSNRVDVFVGTRAEMYQALARCLSHEAKTLEVLRRRVESHGNRLAALRRSTLNEGDGQQLADEIATFGVVYNELRESRWRLHSWQQFLQQGPDDLREPLDKLTDQVEKLAAINAAEAPKFADSVEKLRVSMNQQGQIAALAAAQESMTRLQTHLQENVTELRRVGAFFELIVTLQGLIEAQDRLREEAQGERNRRIQELLQDAK